MGEYKPDGTTIREYIWIGDVLVALRSGYAGHKFQYVLTDHLNTPRAVVLPSSNTIIWRWDLTTTAFGDHAPLNNPDGDAYNFVFNLRYPGQYFDAESGLHYNYFRDYDPSTGRYVQSDPIGLVGGLSTFAYVDGGPFSYSDPLGLRKWHGTPDIVFVGIRGNSFYVSLVGELHSECYDKEYSYNGAVLPKKADLAMNFGQAQFNSYGNDKFPVYISMDDGTDASVVPTAANLAGTARVSAVVSNGRLSGTITMGKASGTISGSAKGFLGTRLNDGPLEFSGELKPGVFQEQDCGCEHQGY